MDSSAGARAPGGRRRTSSSDRRRARGARRPADSAGRAPPPARRSTDIRCRRRHGNAAGCRARRHAAERARGWDCCRSNAGCAASAFTRSSVPGSHEVACTRNHLSMTSASSFHLSWNIASARSRSAPAQLARQPSAAIASVMFSARRNSRKASARAVASSIACDIGERRIAQRAPSGRDGVGGIGSRHGEMPERALEARAVASTAISRTSRMCAPVDRVRIRDSMHSAR